MAFDIKQAWNIKNYRYVWDVSRRPEVEARVGVVWGLWAPPAAPLLAPRVFWQKIISVILAEFSEHFGFWTFSAMHRHNKQKLTLGTGLIG